MKSQRWMWISWPSFLGACVLEMMVFAVFDPHDVHWFGDSLDQSRMTLYTLAFFAFWVINALTCALALLLSDRPKD